VWPPGRQGDRAPRGLPGEDPRVRYAFLELGVEDGIIVARTDSLGAGLTKQIAVTHEPGDLGDKYNSFLDGEYIESAADIAQRRRGGQPRRQAARPKRDCLHGLFQFKQRHRRRSRGAGLHHLAAERRRPAVDRNREAACGPDRRDGQPIRETVPDAKLVYNNSPSFNWTLNFRQQVFDAWSEEGKDVSAYDRDKLMSADYDDSDLAAEADERIRTFQADASREAGIFHHLITLPTYHTAACPRTTWPGSTSARRACSAT
jgi:isocitrate lyase